MVSSPKKILPPPGERRSDRLNLQFQKIFTKTINEEKSASMNLYAKTKNAMAKKYEAMQAYCDEFKEELPYIY